jgi:hypothetical protein
VYSPRRASLNIPPLAAAPFGAGQRLVTNFLAVGVSAISLIVASEAPSKLAVVDPQGELLFWVEDGDEARTLIKKRQARLIRKNGRVRMLVATDAFTEEYGSLDGGRGTAFDKTRYSHNHETDTNPEKVWTLKRLPRTTRPVFTRVLDDCLAA